MNFLNIKEIRFLQAFGLALCCAIVHTLVKTDFIFSVKMLSHLALFSVILLVYLWTMNAISRKISYLPNQYLLPISSGILTLFPAVFEQPNILAISTLLLIVVNLLFEFSARKNPALALVDVSLLIFIGAWFEREVLLFVSILWFSVIFYTPRHLKYLLIPFFTLIPVICFLFLWDIFSAQNILSLHLISFKNTDFSFNSYADFEFPHNFFMLFFLLFVGFSSVLYHRIQGVRFPALLVFYVVLSVISVLLWQEKTTAELVLFNMPLSLFTLNFIQIFSNKKKQYAIFSGLLILLLCLFLWNTFSDFITFPADFELL